MKITPYLKEHKVLSGIIFIFCFPIFSNVFCQVIQMFLVLGQYTGTFFRYLFQFFC